MIETRPQGKARQFFLAAVCALVVGLFFWTTTPCYNRFLLPDPTEAFYNRLIEGFRAGHLYLKTPAPAGLVGLADPYDPQANYTYRLEPPYWLHDMSYYRGRLYVYFGVTPAVILYWPWAAVTGHPLPDQTAAAIFCAVAFLAGAALLRAAWIRYFPGVSGVVVGAAALAFGLATEMPTLLQPAKVYEVAISCGLAMTLLSLGALWRALHSPQRGTWWLAAASLAYGLAIGARPSLAPGAAILLLAILPVGGASRRAIAARLAAVAVPLAIVGSALMTYNLLRFGSPWEFGQHYQLAGDRQENVSHFSLSYLWFNFRVYFLEAVQWHGRLPFVGKIRSPAFLPLGHAPIEDPYGLLTNVPLVWLALAVPLAWRQGAAALQRFLLAQAVLFGVSTLTLLLFYGTCSRYEAEFLPELILLSLFGLLAWEAAPARRPSRRIAARCAWAALLVFSVGFNVLYAVFHYAAQRDEVGENLVKLHRTRDAIPQFELALRLMPDFPAAEANLGNVLSETPEGLPAAIGHFEAALRLDPDNASTRFNLGNCFLRIPGRTAEAIVQYEAAVRLKPNYVEAHYNLGVALLNSTDRRGEALAQFEEALRLRPDSAPARRAVEQLRAGSH